MNLFGTNIVALVTPMQRDGAIDETGLKSLVEHVLAGGTDGLVVAGTTGEAPTLNDAETMHLIRTVAEQARGRARVIAGVGTYDTAATIRRARDAEAAGADALLLVTPYYSKPTQAGVVAHCRAVADATQLPVMLYDIPGRTGIAMSAGTLADLSTHPRIRAVKDAKGDLFEALTIMATTPLAYYCGIDELNLPYLAAGATGLVSVVGNVAPYRNAALIDAVARGDLKAARAIATASIPLTDAIMRTSQGCIMAKAALVELGIIEHPALRMPLLLAEPDEVDKLRAALAKTDLPQLLTV